MSIKRAIYSIQGNIGSGKSTFLNLLKNHVKQVQVIPQPVAQWQKISNKYNLLQQYYRDPSRWAFTFQINAILSRIKQLKRLFQLMQQQKENNKVFFSERSIVADREIFAKLLFQDQKMNQMQYALYNNMYNSLENLFQTPRIHKFIYLRSSPEKCMQRMIKRARHEQIGIPLVYFTNIHRLHEEWLINQPNTLIIQGQQQFQTNPIRAQEMITSVRKFLDI